MSAAKLRDADPDRGWERLPFPPPWWELPAVVAVCATIGHFTGGGRSEAIWSWVSVGAVLYLMRYFDGERAMMHRLDTRLTAMQSQVDRLVSSLHETRQGQSAPPGSSSHQSRS